MIAEWSPDGATENEFVITMAQAAWAKRRRQKHSEVRVSEFERNFPALFERNFPAFKYQSETDRAKAMIERINAELAERASMTHGLDPDWPDIVGLHQTFETVSMEVFKQEIELDERLNAMFCRAMKGLIECKAMKQILRETTTCQNAIEPPAHSLNAAEVNGGSLQS